MGLCQQMSVCNGSFCSQSRSPLYLASSLAPFRSLGELSAIIFYKSWLHIKLGIYLFTKFIILELIHQFSSLLLKTIRMDEKCKAFLLQKYLKNGTSICPFDYEKMFNLLTRHRLPDASGIWMFFK